MFATDSDGLKVWEATYLPFGGVHVSAGAINLRFPGQWFQSESGLHQNWMRDYDPTTGRYLQADPLGLVDGASVYGYVLQSPGRYVDPRGEAAQAVCAAFPQACAAAGAAIVKICVEGAKIVAGAALALVTTTEEACGCEDDCEYEQPLSRLRKLSSRELRTMINLVGHPHEFKDGSFEDVYISRDGCLYVGNKDGTGVCRLIGRI